MLDFLSVFVKYFYGFFDNRGWLEENREKIKTKLLEFKTSEYKGTDTELNQVLVLVDDILCLSRIDHI